MVGTSLFVAYHMFFRNELDLMGKQAISSLLSFANIHFWILTRDYWGAQPEDSWFLHTWSLSLEEQFYFFFPLISLLFLNKAPRFFGIFCVSTTLLGYILFCLFAPMKPQACFYLLPARFWELSIGCTIAIYGNYFKDTVKVGPRLGFAGEWMGFLLIISSLFFLDGREGIGSSMMLPTFGSALYIVFAQNKKLGPAKILSNGMCTFVGKISYSLYLWHWPVLFYSDMFKGKWSNWWFLVLIFISLISYHFIEKPGRKNPKALSYILVGFILCLTGSVYLKFNRGFYDISSFSTTTWNGPLYDVTPTDHEIKWGAELKRKMYGIEVLHKSGKNDLSLENGGVRNVNSPEKPKVLVMGNSHALMWSSVIDEVTKELNLVTAFYGMDSRFPFIKDFSIEKADDSIDYLYDKFRVQAIIENKTLVVLAANWSYYHYRINDIRKTIQFIEKNGGSTLLIEQPPVLFFGDRNAPQYLSYLGHHPTQSENVYISMGESENWQKGNQIIEELSKEFESCSVLKTSELFLNEDNKVLVIQDNEVLYIDDDHLSFRGANMLYGDLKKEFQENFRFKSF